MSIFGPSHRAMTLAWFTCGIYFSLIYFHHLTSRQIGKWLLGSHSELQSAIKRLAHIDCLDPPKNSSPLSPNQWWSGPCILRPGKGCQLIGGVGENKVNSWCDYLFFQSSLMNFHRNFLKPWIILQKYWSVVCQLLFSRIVSQRLKNMGVKLQKLLSWKISWHEHIYSFELMLLELYYY